MTLFFSYIETNICAAPGQIKFDKIKNLCYYLYKNKSKGR